MSQLTYVLRAMVLSLAGMILVYLGVGQMLASQWRVETTRHLSVQPEKVAAVVKDFGTWTTWKANDIQLGPQTRREVQGTPGEVGHKVVWSGPMGTARAVPPRGCSPIWAAGWVSPTLEVIIEEAPEHMKRGKDRKSGLILIKP
jgi:hypothetical protein